MAEAERLSPGAGPGVLAEMSLTRATFLLGREQYAAAEHELLPATDLARKAGSRLLEAEALGARVATDTGQGHYDKALDDGLAALDIVKSIHARHIESGTLLNLGWTRLELGDFIQAIPLFESCADTAKQANLVSFEERCLNSLGRVYFNEDDYPKASQYYHSALDIATGLKDDAEVATYSDNIALVETALNHLDAAEKYNQTALGIQQAAHNHLDELRTLLTTAGIADLRKDFNRAGRLLNTIISDQKTPADLRWQAKGQLANHYVAMGLPKKARKQFPKVLTSLEEARAVISSEENRLAFSTWEAAFYTDYISFLVDQRDKAGALRIAEHMRGRALEEGLAASHTNGATGNQKARSKPTELQLSAVQNFLRVNQQVILYYWMAEKKSFLWVLTPSAFELFPLPGKQEIEERIDRYQARILRIDNVERGDADGQELYRILVQPAQALIPANARVVIVPDGGLSRLNFETLLVPGEKPHFWLRDIAEQENSSSIALLIRPHAALPSNGKSLVMGNPLQASPDYPSLTHAGDEMKIVEGYLPQAGLRVLPGKDATPSAFLTGHPESFDKIHFATHGTASKTAPLESAIILSPEANGFKLYARDIIKTHLNANVVTISACYGAGLRTYSGEGLVGLAWAFLRAGAHNVIAGLWKVDDDATPGLMKNLYQEFGRKKPAEALHAAKMAMLTKPDSMYRFPYYWGSLQLYVGS